ncbi:MAG: alpha-N-arabinofuranosidase [Sphingomonas sp.]
MKPLTNMLRRGALALLMSGTAIAPLHAATDNTPTKATLHADQPGPVYHKEIFTQFAEQLGNGIYGGLWVGKNSKIANTDGFRNDVVGALRELQVPVIRWPGGCYADQYHWRDGIGPQKSRPVRVNTNWGGVTDPNTVGTDEYFTLLKLVGAKAYVSADVGDASPGEMTDWVQYMTAPAGTLADERAKNGQKAPYELPFLGLGNELWGCGGNMRPEYAADVTRRYAAFAKVPDGTKTLKIASGANSGDYNWTDTMMRIAGDQIDGISMHYYTLPDGGWPPHSDPIHFDETSWADTLWNAEHIEELIEKHSAVMDKYDPQKRVMLAVDEWGTWYQQDPGTHPGFLRQQNSLRDAMVASTTLDIFARHADRVRMSAIAQMVNVLQAMVLTDGAKMVRTPTYWVYDMYKPWQDATVLPIKVDTPWYAKGKFTIPAVSSSAVKGRDGLIHIALSNVDPEQANTVTIALDGTTASSVSGTILTAPTITAHNSFDDPDAVRPAAFSGAQIQDGKLVVTMPAKSIVVLTLQ